MLWQMIFEWMAIVLLLGFGLYTVRVIKNEKINYIKEARVVHFHLFKFFVPKWWGNVETNSPD
jgi:hypothetical protein